MVILKMGVGGLTAMHTEQRTWGIEINRRGYGNQAIPDLCLEWATWADKEDWEKKGVVVWSHDAQRVERLSAAHALQYLEHIRTNDDWEVDGIPILRQSTVLRIEDTRKKKGKRKKDEGDLDAEEQSSKGETVVEERFRLSPDQSVEFLKTLEMNEATLQELADEDERERSRVLWEVYSLILKFGREREADEIDFSARPFKWEKEPLTNSWICDRPPNRGSATSTNDNLYWQGCIERPDQFKHYSRSFDKLEAALTWVEQQLEAAEQETDEPKEEDTWQRVPLVELIAQKQEQLADYWIDPATLEPKRITYQAIISLEYAPYDYKTMEMSFGKELRYDEKFASPTQLATELRLDPQLDIYNHYSGFFTIKSRVTYYQQDIAMAQAQRFWDQSTIVQQHRAGKVTRAEYGIVEVETGYEIIMGACEDPDRPYPPPQSREEHLAASALGETLEYALDVEGYRSYLGFRSSRISDEQLLEMMHSRRARSSHIPMEAQLESEKWLRVNKVK